MLMEHTFAKRRIDLAQKEEFKVVIQRSLSAHGYTPLVPLKKRVWRRGFWMTTMDPS